MPPLLVAADRVASTVAQGVHGRRRVGQGDSFWQFRRFIAGDPTLGLTETQYEAKYPNDPALQKDLSDKTVALKELAREILARGDAANAGNAQMARQYYLSIKECGAYLSTRQDGLAVLKLVGQALVTKADGSLAKLR